ncbi:MAG: hypothetical protein A2Y98_01680 [Candidatus Portnoybacteria bacterium RBG_19FT_COMBO_36_7]|uniref:Uncharacterized protein n=1 Tax=Candidatus Portnoybacteria bacterium RBG_19FT_COMBO_36_7 TaxID=1801992 RepID=A0A1G2F6C2_9BACT|nr:MAG: hypothetical protein A2Y98_01680 [Candidatus Portnoybacteria bacterium RBG_19FT_COMBO_36_7]
MEDECKFFESDKVEGVSESEIRSFNNDYDYRCPHCGSSEYLVYLNHIIGCNWIIFSCEKCLIGFKEEDLVGGFFPQKQLWLKEKYQQKQRTKS